LALARPERGALVALTSGALLIGFAPIFVRLADVGYTAAAFWRLALALPVLWLVSRRLGSPPLGAPSRRAALVAGFFFAADLALWHQSIRLTSVANATLLANLAPVFVTFVAWRYFGERVGVRFLIGLFLALAGAGVLLADSFQIGPGTVAGDALGVATALFYAGYLLSVSRLRRVASVIHVMWWTTLTAAALLLPVALATGETFWPGSAHGWLVLLGMAWLSHVGGQGLIAYSMAHLPASFSSVSLLLQPVAAAIFAWLLLAERFSLLQGIGGAIVLSGILLCRLALAAAARPAPPTPAAPR